MVTSPSPTPTIVWCGVASRTHLVYGVAWIRAMAAATGVQEIRLKVARPRAFLGTPAVTLDDIRTVVPASIEVSSWNGGTVPDNGPVWCLSVGAVGIKPWLRLHAGHPGRRIPVVVTDEGLGSYGTWRSRRDAWRRQGVHEPWLTLRTAAVSTATRALTSERWSLHEETRDGWTLNEDIVREFRLQGTRTEPDHRAVFLSQPWPELGVMSERTYLAHVTDVAGACRDVGLEFSVHPHPTEDPRRYAAWSTMAPRPLAELDPGVINAAAVIGASSTALVNLAAIHGTPVMRVATPELQQMDRDLSPRQASLLQHHAGPSVAPETWRSTLSGMLPT